MSFANQRIALVTGANRGIGYEIARQLGKAGLIVLLGVRNRDRGSEARQQLTGGGLNAQVVTLDVTDPATIHSAVGQIKDQFGRLDVLVNNAGIMIDAQICIMDLGIGLLENTLETNAFGPLLLCQAFIPMMREQRYGRIVNMSSTLGSLTDIMHPDSSYQTVGSPAYRLSKTLLNGVTVMLAKELQGTNILVNSVCPGWVRTDMGGDRAPLTPKEAAATPVWLATLPDDGPTGGFFRDHQPIPW